MSMTPEYFEHDMAEKREIIDKYAAAARVIALHLREFCNDYLPYDEMIADAARRVAEELEANRACNRSTWKERALVAEARSRSMADAAEMLWVVLANVSGGDWTKQTPEWQEVAARWRDNYFAALSQTTGSPASVGAVDPVGGIGTERPRA